MKRKQRSQSSRPVAIAVQKLANYPKDQPLPSYATVGSAGMDLRSASGHIIRPNEWIQVETGLCLHMKRGWEAQVRPRSGLAWASGITVLNAPGTIDWDYRGEIKVLLINHSNEAFSIKEGDRIAQLVFQRTHEVKLVELSADASAEPPTKRGKGGFGSTGTV